MNDLRFANTGRFEIKIRMSFSNAGNEIAGNPSK
jgi:hypothetical protein